MSNTYVFVHDACRVATNIGASLKKLAKFNKEKNTYTADAPRRFPSGHALRLFYRFDQAYLISFLPNSICIAIYFYASDCYVGCSKITNKCQTKTIRILHKAVRFQRRAFVALGFMKLLLRATLVA